MSASPSDAESGAWVQVCPTPNMGNGLFAARDIPPGTRMIAETPILTIASSDEHDVERAFCHAWYILPEEKRRKFDELFYMPSLITQTLRDTIRAWYNENGITASDGVVLKGKRLQDASKAMAKRFAIFITNRVQMGSNSAYGIGVFASYSRINHSCIPNSYNSYNPTIGRLTIHSTHEIRAGEQLFISYINGACRTRSQRKNELDKWGFTCTCQACTVDANDQVRSRMFDIDRALAAYESPFAQLARRVSPLLTRIFSDRMPTIKWEALCLAKELVDLLQQQRLEGMELCKTYRECSKYALELDCRLVAVHYAMRELEIERRLIGTETAHLESNMIGAEYWLKHLHDDASAIMLRR